MVLHSIVLLRPGLFFSFAVFSGFQMPLPTTVEIETVVGGPVALECDFGSSNPLPEVEWYDDRGSLITEVLINNAIRYIDGGRYLLIRKLTSAQRERRYHCVVRNFRDKSGSPPRAPTTYAINLNIPANGFVHYLDLGTKTGRVGEPVEFAYVVTEVDSIGQIITPTVQCDGSLQIEIRARNIVILEATLTEEAATASEVRFSCVVSGAGPDIESATGSVRVLSKSYVDTCCVAIVATIIDRYRGALHCFKNSQKPPFGQRNPPKQ